MDRFDGKYISVVTTTGYACIGKMEKLSDTLLGVCEEDVETSLAQYTIRNDVPILQMVLERGEAGDSLLFLDSIVDVTRDWRDHVCIQNDCVYFGVASCAEICWSKSSARVWLSTIHRNLM